MFFMGPFRTIEEKFGFWLFQAIRCLRYYFIEQVAAREVVSYSSNCISELLELLIDWCGVKLVFLGVLS